MTLTEKIEHMKQCIYYNNMIDGCCRLKGYAPFDCEKCSTFKKSSEHGWL